VFTSPPRPARWAKPAEPEPEPLEDFIVARLEPAEAAALIAALDKGQRAAWQRTAPGPDYEARFETACEVARISGQEARAARRMSEARQIHAAQEAAYQDAAARAREPPRELAAASGTASPPAQMNGAQMTTSYNHQPDTNDGELIAARQAAATRAGHEMTSDEARTEVDEALWRQHKLAELRGRALPDREAAG
jgi:hypothetical protein